jgi:hypothetical protein
MSIELIGAGLPRTGTLTQKLALEELGLSPCYHWVNLLTDLDQVELWDRAMDGEVLWEQIFDEARSTADWPGGFFYRQLMEFYPQAKVLLSVREPESWERSFRETIWTLSFGETVMPLLSRARAQIDPRWQRYLTFVDRMFWGPQGTFAAGHSEPAQLIEQAIAHNEQVQRVVRVPRGGRARHSVPARERPRHVPGTRYRRRARRARRLARERRSGRRLRPVRGRGARRESGVPVVG